MFPYENAQKALKNSCEKQIVPDYYQTSVVLTINLGKIERTKKHDELYFTRRSSPKIQTVESEINKLFVTNILEEEGLRGGRGNYVLQEAWQSVAMYWLY